eukprot:TRINITY_DN40033_c0_g1_i1.p1 TRINITY_DN40033_c0_g1~~TRINITY_DN40033_c0_g1_i1.p1  ORF type:complete len:825 (-),score=133.42 TRINITY_DN40033_c0_g1_i1:40-2514(-)
MVVRHSAGTAAAWRLLPRLRPGSPTLECAARCKAGTAGIRRKGGLAERAVLVVRGHSEDGDPKDVDEATLAATLRLARGEAAQALQVPAALDIRTVSGFVQLKSKLDDLLRDDFAGNDVVLLILGLPVAASALLAIEVACTHPSVQAIDAGQFVLAAKPGSSGQAVPSLRTLQRALPPPSASGEIHDSPRPQLVRRGGGMWLDGHWQVAINANGDELPRELFMKENIKLPFPPQSTLGLSTKVSPYEVVWYRREVQIPRSWCGKPASTILLHLDACDWECIVFVNGQPIIKHEGGYDPFVADLGALGDAFVSCPDTFEIIIRAWDPTDAGCEFNDKPPVPCHECCTMGWQPRGKQSLNPGFIMYTGVSGLWRQSPWLERVPKCRITKVLVRVISAAEVLVTVRATCGQRLAVRVRPRTQDGISGSASGVIGGADGECCSEGLRIKLTSSLAAWSPDSPNLYNAQISLDDDTDVVTQHFAQRHVTVVDGLMHLNGVPIFMHGVLYQGYWPESLLTPPSHQALEEDVRAIKAAGFNTIRVHAVVMGAPFYMLCDELGLLVWQDMPSGDGRALPVWEQRRHGAAKDGANDVPYNLDEIVRSSDSRAAFDTELRAMVSWLAPFVSVVVWVLFNEGWGQSDTLATVEWLRAEDPSRLINAASGWNEIVETEVEEKGRLPPLGDFADIHNYEGRPWGDLGNTFRAWPFETRGRIRALGEYGGLGYPRDDHEWAWQLSWGYGDVSRTQGKFREALASLLERLLPVICEDTLGAAIYTQWNDVETEINGLLTYDRLPKLSLETIAEEYSRKIFETFNGCAHVSRSPSGSVSG